MSPLVVRITKKADDPITPTRVSLGAALMGDGHLGGYYCVYRGTREAAVACVEAALAALKALPAEPAIAPDEGKRFA